MINDNVYLKWIFLRYILEINLIDVIQSIQFILDILLKNIMTFTNERNPVTMGLASKKILSIR
jgi:hypothetical protein